MKKILLIIAVAFCCFAASAVPAKRGTRVLQQPDGTKITAFLHGDEVYNYYTDAEGYVLEKVNGFYVRGDKQTEENVIAKRRKSPYSQRNPRKIGTPNTNASRGLFLLVNFTDSTFKSENSLSEMNKMLNEEGYNYGGGAGSVRDYFIEQSGGRYMPQFDVYGPVTLAHPESYYGENVSSGSNTDKNAYQMIIDACNALDSQIDFSLYDTDNDGYIDFVFVIYAGMGAADGGAPETIWPHQWNILRGASRVCRYDGKLLDNYACGPELNGLYMRSGIGTLVHEFGHVLGLPDYYDTQYKTNYNEAVTPNEWNVMDYGPYNNDGYTPPNFSPHDKYFMGWSTPTVLNAAENVVLPADNQTYRYITRSGSSATATTADTVYYVENRQQIGWDEYLPGHGMVVWRVVYNQSVWDSNTPNNTAYKPRYTIISASGNTTNLGLSWIQDSSGNWIDNTDNDAFPSKHNTTSLTPFVSYPITDITEQGGLIRFKFLGGAEESYGDCESYSWTASAALAGDELLLGDYVWTMLLEDDTDLNYDAAKGAKLGSDANPVGMMLLGTEETAACLIDKISITASAAGSETQMSVTIGGHAVGDTVNLSSGTTEYVFSNVEGYVGGIIIEIDNADAAVWLKSIMINVAGHGTDIMSPLGVDDNKSAYKRLSRNGEIVIIRDNIEYDILGRQL